MGSKPVIVIASDHNGNDCRSHLRRSLTKQGHQVVDIGPVEHLRKVDYVDYAKQVAYAVQHNKELRGILICGTGIGLSIAANRFDGVRASLVYDADFARKTREHNDSNVLVLGAWRNSPEEMEEIAAAWLDEEWGAGRHVARVKKIDTLPLNYTLVVVPGKFEILNPGHVKLINHAKSIGTVVVALNSDESFERLEGRKPAMPLEWRKEVIEAMTGVAEVVVNDKDDVGDLVRDLKASYVVKGDNFDEPTVRKNDRLPPDVGVVLFPIAEEYRR